MSIAQKPPERRAYTVREFAALYGRDRDWGYRQVEAGRVKAVMPRFREAGPDGDGRRGAEVREGVALSSHRDSGLSWSWLDYVEDTPLARAVGYALFVVILVGGCMLPGIL